MPIHDNEQAKARARRNWARVRKSGLQLTGGSFAGGLNLASDYYLEKLDKKHRYGPMLNDLLEIWKDELELRKDEPDEIGNFFEWLDTEDFSDLADDPEWEWGDVDGNRLEYCKDERRRSREMLIAFRGNEIVPAEQFPPIDARSITRRKEGKTTQLAFAMSRTNKIYLIPPAKLWKHHSSIFAGEAVKSVGTLGVDNKWQLKWVSNHSGHYQPNQTRLAMFLRVLRRQGVELNAVDVKFRDENKVELPAVDALTWLGENQRAK